MDARHVVGVCAVVRDASGQVLLIRTAQAGWELPGGQVEVGEELPAALVREVREETGCTVTPDRLVSISHRASPPLLLFTFTADDPEGEPAPGDDTLAAGWFPPAAALRMVTHPGERRQLQDGLQPPLVVAYHFTPVEGA